MSQSDVMTAAPRRYFLGRYHDRRLASENARLRWMNAQAQNLALHEGSLRREADHRIKNSLQVVASLLATQAGRQEDDVARSALLTAVTRIRAIAGIHDALQSSSGQGVVELGAALKVMCNSLHAMAGDPQTVSVVVVAEPFMAPVTLAQPVLLAVNELVINALRHGFPENRHGAVHISLTQSAGELKVVVADDGIGLPLHHTEGNGYGMKLVRMMTAQIDGALTVDSAAGSRFTLLAPIS